jgi:hypothetical protein
MISLNHEGRKQLYEKLNRPTVQSIFKDRDVGKRQIALSPIRSSGITMDKHGRTLDDKSTLKDRRISVRGYGNPRSTGKATVDHLETYESD